MEHRVKPVSTSTCLEFLVKSKELTTPTCVMQAYGAVSTEFWGFQRGSCECWGESHHSVTVCQSCLNIQVDLNYADLLLGCESESQLRAF